MCRHLLLSFVLLFSLCLSTAPAARADEPLLLPDNLIAYIAPGATTAVIVCPGGSYCWLDRQTEGVEVAQWLQQNGISAFVLEYRTATWLAWFTHYRWIFRGHQYPDPQDDAEAAFRWVVAHAACYGIDTTRIGMMGFSAGGHLVMSMAGRLPLAFVAPIYPVVTMSAPCVHERSRRGLLGERRRSDPLLCDSLSLERHIPAHCPPVFLVNCKDDPVVHYHNSELLDSALTAAQVPHRYIQYQTGGHGFGVNPQKGTPECRPWKDEFLRWLRSLDDAKQ